MQSRHRNETRGFRDLMADVITADLCCLCGTCAGVCPQGIIRLDGDECLPTVEDEEKCSACGRCVGACPGRAVPHAELLRARPPAAHSSHFGPHVAKFRAAATDGAVRDQAASGGFVTAFLSFLLERGEIDSAIVAGPDPRAPWRSIARAVSRPDEPATCAGSRYTLVPNNAGLAEARGRCALVGLPCHVLGLRKLEGLVPALRRRVVLPVGLFCGVNLDPRATLHILNEAGITDCAQVAGYCSRSAHYGGVRVKLRDGTVSKYPDHDHYGFDVVRLAPLFQRTRCSLCVDNANELADVSVGDAKRGARGESCVVVRTAEALEMIGSAERCGRLSLGTVAPDTHRGNVFKKRRRAFTLMEWMRDQGLPTVDMDLSYDLAREYPWESEQHRDEMLQLRALARSDVGRRLFAGLTRNELARDMGETYVGWKG